MVPAVRGRAVEVIAHVAHAAGGEGERVPGGRLGVFAGGGAVEGG